MNENDYEKLTDTLFLAKVHYRLWEELMKKRGNADTVALVNNSYSTFFEYTRYAHFKALFIELHKLIETRDDTHNLQGLFNTLPDNDQLKSEFEKYQSDQSKTRNGIFLIRNDVEAHSSKRRDPDEAFNIASITSADIKKFIIQTETILNEVGSAYFHKRHMYNDIGESDQIERLFRAIHSYDST